MQDEKRDPTKRPKPFHMSSSAAGDHVLSLDVGTTTIKACIFDRSGAVVSRESSPVVTLSPRPGWSEVEPARLWADIKAVLAKVVAASGLPPGSIRCLGICTMRSTFTTWDRRTGREFHNFITWKDLRADKLVRRWNRSLTLRGFRALMKAAHLITQNERYLAASIYTLSNEMTTCRLLWALENVPALGKATESGDAVFGTLDTWLVHKLTGGGTYVTEISNASGTGLFDPFTVSWGAFVFKMLGIPMFLAPPVVDSAGAHFGAVRAPDLPLDGAAISAVLSDQSASLFGSDCLGRGDAKITLGTGSFLTINTGDTAHASLGGLVPFVSWRFSTAAAGERFSYNAEGAANNTSTSIAWAGEMGLFGDPSQSSELVTAAIENAGGDGDFGLCFVPGFHGLTAPVMDPRAGAGLIGMTPGTGRTDVLRAVLESVAFTIKQLEDTFERESDYKLRNIQIDGGVAQNDFVVQTVATLLGQEVQRATTKDVGAFGVSFLAGLEAGVWRSADELSEIRTVERTFRPESSDSPYVRALRERYRRWCEACRRFSEWHPEEQDA